MEKNKKKIIKDMADRIIHRGPDSDGYYVDSTVALGFRRLSIIDLNTGSQPIYNEKKDKIEIKLRLTEGQYGEIYEEEIIGEKKFIIIKR